MKQIVLIGANFQNKGAEAMALNACAEFQKRFPGLKVVIASYSKSENRHWGSHQIRSATFELIPNPMGKKRILDLIHASFSKSFRENSKDPYLSALANSDGLIDLSGFAMTDKRPFWRRAAYCIEIVTAKIFQKPFIAFTQAYGPFEQRTTRALAKVFLPKVSLIIPRGTSSVKYLKELGLHFPNELQPYADSAYLFEAESKVVGEKLLQASGVSRRPQIGIVPNVNLLKRSKAYLEVLAHLCREITARCSADVVFVCHERKENRIDDFSVYQKVAEKLGDLAQIHCISGYESAAELKSVISNLDFVVASRFHSLVAAISCGIPFLALSWAPKYLELVEEAGELRAVLDEGQQSPESVVQRFRELWDNRHAMANRLSSRRSFLTASAKTAFDCVEEFLKAQSDEISQFSEEKVRRRAHS